MTDNIPKFTIEFDTSCLTIRYRDRDGREVCYWASPSDDMSASARVEFLSSVERWVDDSSDCNTEIDIDINVLSHVIPFEQCIDSIHSAGTTAHDTP